MKNRDDRQTTNSTTDRLLDGVERPFAERLLQVGDTDPSDHGQGHRVFRLVEELYPIESQIYARAIDRLLDLLEDQGAGDDEIQRRGTEARLDLGLTLTPFIRAFITKALAQEAPRRESESVKAFRRLAQPWAVAQMKNAVAYIVTLELQEQQRQHRQGGLDTHSLEQMDRLRQVIEQHGHRPEAARLVEKATREYQLLADQLAQHSQLDSTRARTLSYLLSCTSRGELRDLALAALIMRGNNSPGAEIVANPLQLLDVRDVATVLKLERSQVTSGVSKLRRKASQNLDIAFTRKALDPQQLWRRKHVDLADAKPTMKPKD